MTNWEHLTSSPEVFAEFYNDIASCESCPMYDRCIAAPRGNDCCDVILVWLQEESE